MKKLLLLHTGGTLGMDPTATGALRPGAALEGVFRYIPEALELADIESRVLYNEDSANMQVAHWQALAQEIAVSIDHYDGVVVIHGTDTMAYTACALSFMLQGLRKPVVLTGAQRPLGEIRSDARLNLIDAFTAAAEGPPEVMVCFDSKLFRGNRCTKVKVAEYDAFESPNFPILGSLGVNVHMAPGLKPRGPERLRDALEPKVFLLKLFPGIDPALCRSMLAGVKGLVLEAFGAGNFPLEPSGGSLLPVCASRRSACRPVPWVASVAFRLRAVSPSLNRK